MQYLCRVLVFYGENELILSLGMCAWYAGGESYCSSSATDFQPKNGLQKSIPFLWNLFLKLDFWHPFEEKKYWPITTLFLSWMGDESRGYICWQLQLQCSVRDLWNIFHENSLLYEEPCKHLFKQNILFQGFFWYLSSKLNQDCLYRTSCNNICTI